MAKTDIGPPDYKQFLPPIIRDNYGKWRYHEIVRPGVLKHVGENGDVLYTVRVASPRLLSTDHIREICDLAETYCDGFLRFTSRHTQLVAGILTTSDGAVLAFQYEPTLQIVRLPGEHIKINEYGWEVERIPYD